MIGEQIKTLGKAFRGLWVSRCFEPDQGGLTSGWAVTFIMNGEYCETPYSEDAEGALRFAIKHCDKNV